MSDTTTQIIITVVTMLIALGVGLYLRRLLVHRLKRTVLDNWLIQLFGFLIIIPPVIIGIIFIPYINGWNMSLLDNFWTVLGQVFNVSNYKALIGRLIVSTLIILLAIGVGRTLVKIFTGRIAQNGLNINIRILLGRISYVIVIIIASFWILAVWDIALTVPATVISIITVAFTFVLQDILKNLAAGLYLLVEGPFHIGDEITTSNYTGKVIDVQLRATKLRIGSGDEVIVPNSILFSDIVVNNSTFEENRVTIVITMTQEEYDKGQVPECILKTIKEVKNVMVKPEPELIVSSLTGTFGNVTGTVSGYTGEIVTLTLHFWIPEGLNSVISDAMLALRTALPNADLAIREPVGM
jgi:small conductance mechanosensitive channel